MPRPRTGCYVISLRPRGEHDALRRAAARRGLRVIALSPWRLVPVADAATRAALRAALDADVVVFTSPAAVRAARALRTLRARRGQAWCAVGSGTAAALRRAGIARVQTPDRMDSEGLLALPELNAVRGVRIGVVTAPGGRDRLVPGLVERGAQVVRADVYRREPLPPAPRAVAALRALDAPAWLALSSGEALAHLLTALPADAAAILRRARVVAASDRLAAMARNAGFTRVARAAGPRPRDLVAAVQAS
jgi:uroporphyrinogen-III synthase